jgi:hypothetical protein
MGLISNLRSLLSNNGVEATNSSAEIPVEMAEKNTAHKLTVSYTSTKTAILSVSDEGSTMFDKVNLLFGGLNSDIDMYILWEDGRSLSGEEAKNYVIDSSDFPTRVTLGASLASNG